ncbi:MAG: 2'-deoxycytidine 5'-triphosphate deaminase [Geminicoccaceae bacterium]|nr:2'-deoxycytidine 5'-triphosphate deaminase [Geminicoccaceae bacterium]
MPASEDDEPELFASLPEQRRTQHGLPQGTTTRTTGILPSHRLEELLGWQVIAPPLAKGQVQPSSIDLRLGAEAFLVEASFLPGSGRTVAERIAGLTMARLDLREGAVLERGSVYIVPLLERLELRKRYSGIANPKSSTGRLDVFTRLITDYGTEFDRVPANYRGPLYAEISPRSFNILAREGARLLQLRIQRGSPRPSDAALRELHDRYHLIPDEDDPDIKNAGVAIRVDISGVDGSGIIGYRARKNVTTPIDLDNVGAYAAKDFWQPVTRPGRRGLILRNDDFYILASRQAVWVPPDTAGEMIAYDTSVGEFRVHYAGFFDPGFGYHADGTRGTRAVLEVRAHEVPFIIDDNQIMGRIVYHDLIEPPYRLYGQDIGSNYARQGLTLAKHFRPWAG